MRTLRRIAALGITALVAGAFATSPASADTYATYTGSALGQALHLNALGTELTIGKAEAKADSTVSAAADAAGQLTPLVQASSTSAQATAQKLTESNGPSCAPGVVPAPLNTLLSLDAACSQSLAEIVGDAPHAHSEGSVASAGLLANTVLSQLNQATAIGDVLSSALQPVVQQINSATGQNITLDPGKTLNQLINDLTQTKTLSVSLGKSVSDVSTDASHVTSLATAQGATIQLFPVDVLNHTPLATITIGAAQAKVIVDRATGKATPSFDPALVTVDLAPLAGLPVGAQHFTVPVGTSQTILPDTPLESTITVASGSTSPDGTQAVADGVSLQLFKGLSLGATGTKVAAAPAGGITLELAHAVATGSGAPGVTEAKAGPAQPLAYTGPRNPWLPMVGALLLGLALGARRFVLVRR